MDWAQFDGEVLLHDNTFTAHPLQNRYNASAMIPCCRSIKAVIASCGKLGPILLLSTDQPELKSSRGFERHTKRDIARKVALENCVHIFFLATIVVFGRCIKAAEKVFANSPFRFHLIL
jgi:hypothetical protein